MGGLHRCASADNVYSIDLVHSEEELAEVGSTTLLRFDEIGRTDIEVKNRTVSIFGMVRQLVHAAKMQTATRPFSIRLWCLSSKKSSPVKVELLRRRHSGITMGPGYI